MIKAIIFDLDGVLIDATEWHYEALNRALQLFGFEITRDMHLNDYNGLPTRKKLKMLAEQRGFPLALTDFTNDIKQIYTQDVINNKCKPSFDKEYMLAKLEQEGYVLAVCSNSIKENVERMLKKAGIFHFFKAIVGNDEGYPSKPDPTMYIETMKKLNLNKEDVIIVEDAPHGIKAAKDSGANVCEVKGFYEVNYDKIKNFVKDVQND